MYFLNDNGLKWRPWATPIIWYQILPSNDMLFYKDTAFIVYKLVDYFRDEKSRYKTISNKIINPVQGTIKIIIFK